MLASGSSLASPFAENDSSYVQWEDEMTVQIMRQGDQLGVADIRSLESQLNARFTKDYQEFLLSHNVAEPEANIYKNGSISTSVRTFYGVSQNENNDIVAVNARYEGRLPKEPLRRFVILQRGGDRRSFFSFCCGLQGNAARFSSSL